MRRAGVTTTLAIGLIATPVTLARHAPVYVANGSHAAYFTAGVHARPFPDPHDEARGDGAVVRPPVEAVADGRPGGLGPSLRLGRPGPALAVAARRGGRARPARRLWSRPG